MFPVDFSRINEARMSERVGSCYVNNPGNGLFIYHRDYSVGALPSCWSTARPGSRASRVPVGALPHSSHVTSGIRPSLVSL